MALTAAFALAVSIAGSLQNSGCRQFQSLATSCIERSLSRAPECADAISEFLTTSDAALVLSEWDPTRAKALFQRAWFIGSLLGNSNGLEQEEVVDRMCKVDVQSAKRLAAQQQQPYWLNVSPSRFLKAQARFDPLHGGKYLNELGIGRQEAAWGVARDFGYENPLAAARLIRSVRGIDHESLLVELVKDTAGLFPSKSYSLIATLVKPENREEATYEWLRRSDASADKTLRFANRAKSPLLRVLAMFSAAEKLRSAHLAEANRLIEKVCDLILDAPDGSELDEAWQINLLQCDLVSGDEFLTDFPLPCVRRVLERLDARTDVKSRWQLMRAAASWVPLNLARGESLMKRALAMGPPRDPRHGTLFGEFESFVLHVAQQDPDRAVAWLRRVDQPRLDSFVAQKIVRGTLRKNWAKGLRAIALFKPMVAHPEELVDFIPQQRRGEYALSHPRTAKKVLREMAVHRAEEPNYYYTSDVIKSVALKNLRLSVAAAIDIVSADPDPSERIWILCDMADELRMTNSPVALKLLTHAERTAVKITDPSGSARGLIRVAESAVRAVKCRTTPAGWSGLSNSDAARDPVG